MQFDDTLSALVEQAYAAALDNTLWESCAHAFCRAFGGHGGIFSVVDEQGPTAERTINLWSNPRTIEEYLDGLLPLDPQLPVVTALAQSSIYLDTDHVDLENRNTAEFTKWIESHGGRHHMTAVALLGDGTERACISIHHHIDEGPTPLAQQHRLAAAFPAIGHAFGLAFRHGEQLGEAFWQGVTALEDGRASLLLDERGRVMRATASALRMIDGRDGLTLFRGTFGSDRAADDARLGAAIAGAIRRATPVADAIRIQRTSGRSPFLVTIYPLARSHRMLAPLEAAAIVTIVDPSEAPVAASVLWRKSLGFTSREAALAGSLASGHSVESAAAALEMAMPTARTHLRALFRKTGTDRQGALLQLLSRLR